MKKPSRTKSLSSLTVSVAPPPIDLDFFSCHSHEQVHIYEKLSSSISSLCEIAYCSSEGIIICVPQTSQRQPSSALSSVSSSSLCPMLIARIAYPFESTDPANSSTVNSSSNVFFTELKEKMLPKLYKAYKHRPTSLSSFDRLLCSETIHSKGFRSCLFSPLDVTLNEGESILATISCAHEVFIYEIIPSSKRFFHSQSSTLKVDLTERLRNSARLNEFLRDSDSEDDSRLLYFHLTSSILWNDTGTQLFQLQSSGHLIVWNWDRSTNLFEEISSIIDTKIVRSMSMLWNEEMKILIVIGKENQRVLVHLETSRIVTIETNDNDFMNTEHAELLRWKDRTLVLIESKINYCFISTIDIDDDQSKVNQRCWTSRRKSFGVVADGVLSVSNDWLSSSSIDDRWFSTTVVSSVDSDRLWRWNNAFSHSFSTKSVEGRGDETSRVWSDQILFPQTSSSSTFPLIRQSMPSGPDLLFSDRRSECQIRIRSLRCASLVFDGVIGEAHREFLGEKRHASVSFIGRISGDLQWNSTRKDRRFSGEEEHIGFTSTCVSIVLHAGEQETVTNRRTAILGDLSFETFGSSSFTLRENPSETQSDRIVDLFGLLSEGSTLVQLDIVPLSTVQCRVGDEQQWSASGQLFE